jgi:hypothetical protein
VGWQAFGKTFRGAANPCVQTASNVAEVFISHRMSVQIDSTESMKLSALSTALGGLLMALLWVTGAPAQQANNSVHENSDQTQASGLDMRSAGSPSAVGVTPSAPSAAKANDNALPKTSSAGSQPATPNKNPFDPLLEPPPLPKGKPTLIGGLAIHVDQVRNRLMVKPFGGGAKVKMFVDERSHIYRDGTETTVLGIHKGDRVYVDTMLDGSRVFAKNVRVVTQAQTAQMRGQVMEFNPGKGILTIRDQLSVKPVNFAVNPETKYRSSNGSTIVAGDLQPGSLATVQFTANGHDYNPVAREVSVLAKPGESYVFSGIVLSLDMSTSSLAVRNRSDQQTYELRFNSSALPDPRALKIGSDITAQAVFDGKEYKANNIEIEKTNQEQDAH